MKEKLLCQLQAVRDNLCNENAASPLLKVHTQNPLDGDRYVIGYGAGYGAGVEAMWEAAEDAVKALNEDAQGD